MPPNRVIETFLNFRYFSQSLLPPPNPAQHRRSEVGKLIVSYVFALEMSGKYLKVTISYAQKTVNSGRFSFFYENVN